MNVLQRIRSFWLTPSADDRPLSERERDEDQAATAYDERARTVEEFVSRDLDPDEPASGRID
jgi:YD repeat-containing protein